MTRKEEIDKYAREVAANPVHCVEIDVTHACEWADRTMINKVTEWLFKNITHRVSNGIGNGLIINFDSYSEMTENLRKAMEE